MRKISFKDWFLFCQVSKKKSNSCLHFSGFKFSLLKDFIKLNISFRIGQHCFEKNALFLSAGRSKSHGPFKAYLSPDESPRIFCSQPFFTLICSFHLRRHLEKSFQKDLSLDTFLDSYFNCLERKKKKNRDINSFYNSLRKEIFPKKN